MTLIKMLFRRAAFSREALNQATFKRMPLTIKHTQQNNVWNNAIQPNDTLEGSTHLSKSPKGSILQNDT